MDDPAEVYHSLVGGSSEDILVSLILIYPWTVPSLFIPFHPIPFHSFPFHSIPPHPTAKRIPPSPPSSLSSYLLSYRPFHLPPSTPHLPPLTSPSSSFLSHPIPPHSTPSHPIPSHPISSPSHPIPISPIPHIP